MSGTAATKPPKNNAEWARNTEKRLNQTEHPTSARVGPWVLSTHAQTGNLIASHVDGGGVVLAVSPDPSADPDVVAAPIQPFLKLERQNNQNEPRGATALVLWDTAAFSTPEWGFVPEATDIAVPEDGVYEIAFHLAFLNSSDITSKAVVLIEAVVKMAQEFNPENGSGWFQSMYMSDIFTLTAGQIVSCGAFVSGSGTFDFGASGADPAVFTSLTLRKMEVE